MVFFVPSFHSLLGLTMRECSGNRRANQIFFAHLLYSFEWLAFLKDLVSKGAFDRVIYGF